MKRFGRLLATGLAAFTLAGSALGSEEPSRPDEARGTALESLDRRVAEGPTVGDLVAYAYQASPMVDSARAMWRAAAEKYRVDTGYPDPKLMLEGMYMQETFGDKAGPEDWRVQINQMIPLPGRLGRAGEVSQAEAKAARIKLDQTVRDVATQIRESYHELLYIQEAKRVAAANRDLLDQLRKVGEAAYAQSRAALIDVMKAQSQSGQLLYDTVLLEELARTEKTRLNGLLNRRAGAPIGPLGEEPVRPMVYSVDEIYALGEKNREEIRSAEVQVRRAEAMIGAARYETLPEVELGVIYGREDMEKMVGFQVGFTIPVWLGKNAGRIGQARAEAESARAMKTAQMNETRTMVRDNYFRLQNSERLVRLYRDDLIPQAAKAMETAEIWYRQSQGSFSDYVETQAVSYNFQLALARARADYGKFLARLEALAGKSLTERDGADAGGSKEDAR